MQSDLVGKNAVAAIRVSTTKQGTEGDSPEAQKEQIERFAKNKGIVIKKFFVFMESASKEQQPMQEAVDYCANPKNHVDLFITRISHFKPKPAYLVAGRKPCKSKQEKQTCLVQSVLVSCIAHSWKLPQIVIQH